MNNNRLDILHIGGFEVIEKFIYLGALIETKEPTSMKFEDIFNYEEQPCQI